MDIITTAVTPITLDAGKIVHAVKADFVERRFPPTVKIVQYDKSLPVIAASLYQGGAVYTIPAGAAVNIRVRKPDGTFVYNCAIGCDTNRQVVYFEVSEQMAAAYGDGRATVELVVNGEIAGTSLILLQIEENPVPEDAIESSNEYQTIYDLYDQIKSTIVNPVTRASEMTDTSIVYLYIGDETGYNKGHMYYYNGSTWVDAGIASTDRTLTISGMSADAKATGDAVAAVQADVAANLAALEAKLLATFPTDTATGTIATFPDGADNVPVKSLSVAVEAVQSGSGDPSPSNVRPISGWDAVTVMRTGKNLFQNKSGESPYTSSGITFHYNDDGTMTINGTASANVYSRSYAFNTFHLPAGTYTVSIWVDGSMLNNNDIRVRVGEGAPDYGYKTITVNGKQTVTLDKSGDYSFAPMVSNGATFSNAIVGIQVENGNAVTEFANPSDDTYTIPLPQTVYGGTLDVATGVLTVDKVVKDLGTLTWTLTNSTLHFFRTTGLSDHQATDGINYLCSAYQAVSSSMAAAAMPDKSCNGNTTVGAYFYIRDTDHSDAASLKASLNGVQLIYEVENPQTIQLTPTEVSTLLGDNNIYADAGSVSVVYRADTGLYIDKRLSNA